MRSRYMRRYPAFEDRKRRFLGVLADMVARLEDASGWHDDLGDRIDEAGYLALTFEFIKPPVQHLYYSRDGKNSILPPGCEFPQLEPIAWLNLERSEPKVMYAFGYRLNDPAKRGAEEDLHWGTVEENDDENEPRFGPSAVDAEVGKYIRGRMLICLQRWLREAEMIQPPPRQAEATADPTDKPNATGYVARPSDPSVYVPIKTIRADHCDGIALATIKVISRVVEDFSANSVRWTRPLSKKTGTPHPQRRSVHLSDWLAYVNQSKARPPSTTEGGFPDLAPDEIDARKTAVRRDRKAG